MTTTRKQQNLTRGLEEERAREEKRLNNIIGSFSASFMSNAKWRKVLSLLANSSYLNNSPYLNNRYRWKFVDGEKIYETPIVEVREIAEKHLKDSGGQQPFVYKEVEWLEIVTDCTKEITDELLERGQFALENTGRGFKIIGYAL